MTAVCSTDLSGASGGSSIFAVSSALAGASSARAGDVPQRTAAASESDTRKRRISSPNEGGDAPFLSRQCHPASRAPSLADEGRCLVEELRKAALLAVAPGTAMPGVAGEEQKDAGRFRKHHLLHRGRD